MEKYTVKGHSDLARDPNNGSIVNVNKTEYEQYLARRDVKNEKNQKVQNLEDELANMKDDINEIKFLLKELVNGPK
jgi:TolA-binding protein|tara:strand:+ start:94 stop:321 length:228 start_codon:yes stop_codon:yes gene_type:complete